MFWSQIDWFGEPNSISDNDSNKQQKEEKNKQKQKKVQSMLVCVVDSSTPPFLFIISLHLPWIIPSSSSSPKKPPPRLGN